MWFDVRPKSTADALAHKQTVLSAPFKPVSTECLCSVRVLTVKLTALEDSGAIEELIRAFGDVHITFSNTGNGRRELKAYFYDSRDVYKAASVLPRFSECRDCFISPVKQDIVAVQVLLPQEISKEELWFEISKYGDIAWYSCERVAGKFVSTYLLFDSRAHARLTQNPLLLNGHCLNVTEKIVPHEVVCRFKSKVGMSYSSEHLENKSPSPILSTLSIPALSPDRNELIYSPPILATESRKPSFLNILASPPYSDTGECYKSADEPITSIASHNSELPSQLTPPMQEQRVFAAAITPPTTGSAVRGINTSPEKGVSTPYGSTGKGNNKVDLDLIDTGGETRTTVMLRNIPNKVNLSTLRRFLDETNSKTYDFLYLRMDFNNKCNVGYAFINFTHPKHIATLTRARCGKKWSQYNSIKIIDICFANIQGRSALVDKFRDSPIMNMDPEYRPKLYYTSGKRAGEEQPFP